MLDFDPRELEILLEVLDFEEECCRENAKDDPQNEEAQLAYADEMKALATKIRGLNKPK